MGVGTGTGTAESLSRAAIIGTSFSRTIRESLCNMPTSCLLLGFVSSGEGQVGRVTNVIFPNHPDPVAHLVTFSEQNSGSFAPFPAWD
jgi:hypothetical protein